MGNLGSTLRDDSGLGGGGGASGRCPGLLLLFCCGRPAAITLPLNAGPVELGRGTYGPAADPRMSRRHARVAFDGNRFWVTDLGSQNGTLCDGKLIAPNQATEVQRVVRMGDSVFGIFRDITQLADTGVLTGSELIAGPALRTLLAQVKQAAGFGNTLHITGESGTGKELVAQTFHKEGPRRDGPFIPVNCAAIPQGLAERLLFGVRRGAYSGADAHAEGYIQAAAGGTLFLDEIGDLELGIQAKLLRVLETRELFPLGAARPHTVDLQICSATNKDLKQQVAMGRFREDLYYRIGRPIVSIAALRKRPEEIPWHIEAAVRRLAPVTPPASSLIEACLLRPWPGNIRELLVEIRSATQNAACEGSARVEARHLPPGAGMALRATPDPITTLPADPSEVSELSEPTPRPTPPKPLDSAERTRLETALRMSQGNVSSAARALGLHRTQMRRLLDRYGLAPQRFSTEDKPGIDMEDL